MCKKINKINQPQCIGYKEFSTGPVLRAQYVSTSGGDGSGPGTGTGGSALSYWNTDSQEKDEIYGNLYNL